MLMRELLRGEDDEVCAGCARRAREDVVAGQGQGGLYMASARAKAGPATLHVTLFNDIQRACTWRLARVAFGV